MQDEFLSYYTISLTISLTKKLLQKKKNFYMEFFEQTLFLPEYRIEMRIKQKKYNQCTKRKYKIYKMNK